MKSEQFDEKVLGIVFSPNAFVWCGLIGSSNCGSSTGGDVVFYYVSCARGEDVCL